MGNTGHLSSLLLSGEVRREFSRVSMDEVNAEQANHKNCIIVSDIEDMKS